MSQFEPADMTPAVAATPGPPRLPLGLTAPMLRRGAVLGGTLLGVYLVVCAVLVIPVSALSDAQLGVAGTLKAVVIVAAAGLHGSLFFAADTGGDSGFNGSLTYVFVPFLLLAVVLGLGFVLARRDEQTQPSASTREALLSALASSVLCVAVLAVLARVCHLHADSLSLGDSGGGGDNATVGAAVVPLLIWGIPLLFLAQSAGRLAALLPRTANVTLPTWLSAPTRGIAAWFTASALHLAVSAVGLAVGGFIYGLITSRHEIHESSNGLNSDLAGFLAFLYVLPNLAVAATGLFMGFSVGTGGIGAAFGGRDSFGLLHGDLPAADYLWTLIPLAVAALVGVRRALQDAPKATLLEDWWRAGAGAALLWLPVTFLLRVGLGGSLGSASLGLGFTALSWIPLAFAWGVLLLVLGRLLVGPLCAKAPNVAARLGGRSTDHAWQVVLAPSLDLPIPPAPVVDEAAEATPGLAAEASAWTVLPAAPVQTGPVVSRRTKVVAGAVLLVLVAGTVAYKVLDSQVFTPDSAAADYLHALEAGEVSKAVSLRADPTGSGKLSFGDKPSTALLDNASLPTGHRITGAKVVAVKRHGGVAAAKVRYTVGAEERTDTLLLRRHGSRAGIFHGWQVVGGENSLDVDVPGVDDVLVNGVKVHLTDGRATLTALPGTYDVTLASSTFLTLEGEPAAVSLYSSTSFQGQLTLSDDARAKATAAATAYVTACLAKATTLETPCGFNSYVYGDTYEKVHWALSSTPSFEVTYDSSNGQLEVRSTGSLTATVTGIAVQPDFFGGGTKRMPFNEQSTSYVSGQIDPSASTYAFVPS